MAFLNLVKNESVILKKPERMDVFLTPGSISKGSHA